MSIIREFLDKNDCGGFCELNSSYKGIHIEDEIIKLEFKKLYTHLIIKFFDEGLIGEDIFDLVKGKKISQQEANKRAQEKIRRAQDKQAEKIRRKVDKSRQNSMGWDRNDDSWDY